MQSAAMAALRLHGMARMPIRSATVNPKLLPARCVIARSTSKVASEKLLDVAIQAADKGAEVVMANTSRPKQTEYKEGNDVVTDTDKAAEVAIVECLRQAYPGHAILGEEGGVLGDISSDYLWVIDPLDGTCSFSTGYMSFCVSVGVLRHATPVAGCVIEFIGGGPGGIGGWHTRKFTARRNGGAFLDGKPLQVSRTKRLQDAMIATEAVYYPDQWQQLSQLYTAFTRDTRGVRMSGSAAANCCHLAMGVIDGYVQYNLKPWDVAAGALIAEEAGARITTADGRAWSVFDRSLVMTNDLLHQQIIDITDPATSAMIEEGVDMRQWCIPRGYKLHTGAQLE